MRRTEPLTPEERRRLERIRSLSRMLDEAVRIPGTKLGVGLDALIGLMPVAGDVLMGFLSFYIVRQAARFGVPGPILARMIANVLVDIAAGAVPVAGDVVDIFWKANRKNMALLDEWLKEVDVETPPIIDV